LGKFALVGLINTCLCIFVPVVIGYLILVSFPILLTFPWFFLIILLGFAMFLILPFSTLLVTKISLALCNWRFPPRVGSFDIDLSVKEIRGWLYRRAIKALANNLIRVFHWNWLTVLTLRWVGIKVGKNAKLYGVVVDDPFIEIGDNFILAKRSVIAGHLYDHYKLTFNKTIIGNNCIIEPVAGAVGATLGDYTVIRKGCGALRGQKTRGNGCFEGVPMRRVTPELTHEEYKKAKQFVEEFNRHNLDKEEIAPIKINEFKLAGVKILCLLIGALAATIIAIIYYYLIFSPLVFQLGGFFGISFALLLAPFFIIFAIGFFLAFLALAAKAFITYIPEGTYELDSAEAKTWKFSYLVKKFCIGLIDASIIDIIDIYILRFFGNKIGKNVILKEAIVDPEYLEIGDFVNIAVLSRIHTHNVIDGKLVLKGVKIGHKVVIGGVSHLDVGCEVGDGAILGIATYCKPNKKLKGNALWMGNPPAKFPKSMLKKIWIEPEKNHL